METNTTVSDSFMQLFQETILRPSPTMIFGSLAALLFLVFKVFLVTIDPREPPVLKPSFPIIGHLLGFMKYQSEYTLIMSKKTSSPIVTIPMLNRKSYVIFSGPTIALALKNKDMDIGLFVETFTPKLFGMSKEGMAILLDKSNGFSDLFFRIMHETLKAKDLRNMNEVALGLYARLLNDVDPATGLQLPSLYAWVKEHMTLFTSDALWGSKNPFRAHPSIIEDLWIFDSGISSLLASPIPSLSAAYKARERLQKKVRAYYAAKYDQNDDVAEIIRRRGQTLRDYNYKNDDIGGAEFVVLHAGTQNAMPAIFWMLARIFTRPELVQRLRDEIEPTVTWDAESKEAKINIITLEKQCPLLLSCYNEAIRHSNFGFSARAVKDDMMFADANGKLHLIKKGYDIMLPLWVAHNSEDTFGKDVNEFDPDRFLPRPEMGVDGAKAKERKAMFKPFGGGKHYCPGRNFALAEVIGFTSALIVGFDIRGLREDKLKMRIPLMGEQSAKPQPGLDGGPCTVTRRQSWEHVTWSFEC